MAKLPSTIEVEIALTDEAKAKPERFAPKAGLADILTEMREDLDLVMRAVAVHDAEQDAEGCSWAYKDRMSDELEEIREQLIKYFGHASRGRS